MGWVRGLRCARGIAALSAVVITSGSYPASAGIDNTATVTGTPVRGTLSGVLTDTVSVPVELTDAQLTVSVKADDASFRNAGDVVVYTYTIVNSGNVTIRDIRLVDTHKGVLGFLSPSAEIILSDADPRGTSNDSSQDGVWDILYPGDSVSFSATYEILQADVDSGADIINTVGFSATYGPLLAPLTLVSTEDVSETVTVALADPRMEIEKSADIASGARAGDVITYTYLVTNTGNVRIDNVSVTDTHKGVVGGVSPVGEEIVNNADPRGDSDADIVANDGVWSVLYPGDSIRFTATYTVTQDDVDTLQ